ncbi:MAG TPA: hypothetical protein VEK73_04170 [Xanthobacteraceae bacterium]|nr:hypothetical protein [Xanthobacteraceae bacterium]
MNTVMKLVCSLAVAVALALSSVPARAQFGGDQMDQFAPMLEMMKKKMGKKRFARMMQTMGPMMVSMMGNDGGGFGGAPTGGAPTGGAATGGGLFGEAPGAGGGTGGNFGGGGFSGGNFGGMANMFGSGQDMGGMMGMLGSGQGFSGLMSMIGSFGGHHGRRVRGVRHPRAG